MTIKTAELITAEDKRNKQCAVCGEAFRDNTRPMNKATCSPECGKINKNDKRREDYRLINPPQPNQKDLYYNDGLTYSFWSDTRIGHNQMWKTDVPYDPDKIQNMRTAEEMEKVMGGRKRRKEVISYNGDETGSSGVFVKFADHKHKKASEVVVIKMEREDMEQYLADKYSK